MNIKAVKELNLYFTLISVEPLPEDWINIVEEIRSSKKVLIQFFKQGSIVTELVPFLLYNVDQAFKYRYNSLKGFEQELLVALYGKKNFQEALSKIGASVCEKASVLLASGSVEELEGAITTVVERFSEKGSSVKPFEDERGLFVELWSKILEESGFKDVEADYCRVLELVKERIATIYL